MALSHRAAWSLSLFVASSFASSIAAVRAQEPEKSFHIGAGDVLRIAVWKEPDLSSTVQVRPDGIISIPVAGDFQVVGRTPGEVRSQLTAALGEIVTAPSVVVIVEEINSRKFFMTGKVANPGAYDLIRPTRLLQAIAMAGGTTEFAKKDRIIVLREDGESRFEVSLKAITRGAEPGDNILLQPGDTVIVP